MLITVERWARVDARREELEFLLGQIGPVAALLRESHARLSDAEGDLPEEQAVLERLLHARGQLRDALGEALLEHVASGGRIELRT